MRTTEAVPKPATADSARTVSLFSSGMALVFYVAAAKLLLHLLVASRYGYFGDELYYLACSEHLDWGYVDQPPLIALTTWFSRHLTGDSLLSLRALPALAGAGKVVVTGLIARELGARRFGMAFSALCVACGGIYFVLDYLMTMNTYEPLIWMGSAYVVIRIIKTGDQKLWLWFGLLSGIGLETKYSMAIFGFAVVVGLLLTPERRAFASKWIWIAGALAFALFLPNLIWNVQHHWPFMELMRNIKASGRDIELGPIPFMVQQIMVMNPLIFPVWFSGLLFFFFARDGKRFRVLGWTYLVTLTVLILLKGKDYYLAPAYPMLLAGGAVLIENTLGRSRRQWLKPTYVAGLLIGTALLLPLGLPILSVEKFVRYQSKLPFKLPASEKSHLAATLPHYYAWQFGWEETTAAAARVYFSLPPEERAKAAIFGGDFGEAGAIDFFGRKYDLPKAIATHQNYWLWGPRNYSGEIVILLGASPERARRWFEQVEIAAEPYNAYARPVVNRPVLLCRRPKQTLQEAWPRLKQWD